MAARHPMYLRHSRIKSAAYLCASTQYPSLQKIGKSMALMNGMPSNGYTAIIDKKGSASLETEAKALLRAGSNAIETLVDGDEDEQNELAKSLGVKQLQKFLGRIFDAV